MRLLGRASVRPTRRFLRGVHLAALLRVYGPSESLMVNFLELPTPEERELFGMPPLPPGLALTTCGMLPLAVPSTMPRPIQIPLVRRDAPVRMG